MTTALVLSGGGAKGSFEVGALQYLYENGFFASMICSTSVGSVNAIQLAHGGSATSQKAAFDTLKTIWQTELRSNTDMYTEAPWLRDVPPRTRKIIEDLLAGDIDYPRIARDVIFFPPYALAQAVALGIDVGQAIDAVKNAPSIFTLKPTRDKIVQHLDSAAVADSGVELRMVAVSLDNGAIRYITQDGQVLETDGRPVPGVNLTLCAVEKGAYDDALRARDTAQLEALQARSQPQEHLNLQRAQEALKRANARLTEARRKLDQCMTASQADGTSNRLVVDVVDGVIASSTIPGAFPPVMLGEEAYVDGGVRWVLPLKAAFDFDTDSIVAINTSPAGVSPAKRNYRDATLLDIGERSALEIMLWETQERHLEAAKAQALLRRRKVWVITPRVEVHDTLTIDRGLIDINIAYGWMRAADVLTAFPFTVLSAPVEVLTPLGAGESGGDAILTRPGEPSPEQPLPSGVDVLIEQPSQPTEGLFVDEASDPALALLADAIARCRRYCWEVEHQVFGGGMVGIRLSPDVPLQRTPDPYALDEVRLYKTILGLLVDARRELNGKLPSDSTNWADSWERHWWDPSEMPGVGNTPWNEFNSPSGTRPAETRLRSMVVKAPDRDEIYLLTPLKHWITSPEALEQVLPGIGFAGVKVIPAEFIDAFPAGANIDVVS